MNVSTRTAVVVRAGEARAMRWGPAGVIRILAGAASTGSFSIVETTEEPGSAAPLHVHHGEDEAFFVLEGTIELTCGDETFTATAGDFIYTPADVPHRYSVVGAQSARVLLFFSRPGFEEFFIDAGAPLDGPPGGPPPPEVLAKYDLELLETHGH
jgi:quercetin dioxygenase-like cupin family protein